MLFSRSVRIFVIGILAIGIISYGLRLYAQQGGGGGGLTPPPKPSTPNPSPTGKAANVSAGVTDGPPFVVGERLSFNVSWSNFSTAARLELEVTERGQFFSQDSFQIKTKVETSGQVRSLFGEIDNQYISYISTSNAVPHRVVNSVRQGQKQKEETVIFDHAKRVALFPDEITVSIPAGTYDFTSLLYGLRLRSLSENSKQKLIALYGREVIEIEAVVKGRERITTQAGTYNAVCVKFDPQKKFSKYRANIWFSDDKQKLPILMTAKLPFGDVRAELTSAAIRTRSATPLAKLIAPTDESGNPPNGINGTNGKHSGSERSLPFVVGERLNYDISWGNFASVGRASFEVRQQGLLGTNRVFEFYGEATSTGAARTLINVNDQVSSFALVDKLTPVRTDLQLREGKRIKQVSAAYNWAKNSASLSTGSEVSIRPGTLDLVSLFYATRAADLKIGASYNFPFLDANLRLRMVTIKAVKQEPIGGPMGTRDAWQLDILTTAPTQVLIAQAWISNDARRLPLYIATRTRFGELRFQMTSAVNTK
ncbi:MAG: DUF3108 domain-containing protein [Acidobacteria bacterium]|nr:DUF3108 domain-containing protein [Acidobacteriota bacterium]